MRRLVLSIVLAGLCVSAVTLFAHSAAADSPAAPARDALSLQNSIVLTAKHYLGYPYAWIGDSPSGFSCIGFAYFVYGQNNIAIPYDLAQSYNDYPHVDRSNLQPGDLLFFSNTVFAGLSHVAIYIGNNMMIGADNFQVGVSEDNINDPYWVRFYTGASRPLATVAGSGVASPSATGGSVATALPTTPAATPTLATAVPTTAAPLVTVAAAAVHAGTVLVTQSDVALHSGPGTQYMSVAQPGAHTVLFVVEAPQNDWYHVAFNDGEYGWVQAAAVVIASESVAAARHPAVATPAPVVTKRAPTTTAPFVTTDALRVHSAPAMNAQQIGLLERGSGVTLLQRVGLWGEIRLPDGQLGWIDTAYISMRGALATQPSVRVAGFHVHHALPLVVVVADALWVRSAPAQGEDTVMLVRQGQQLGVLSRAGHWDYVVVLGRLGQAQVRGWVFAAWVR